MEIPYYQIFTWRSLYDSPKSKKVAFITSPTEAGGSEYDLISAMVGCFSSSIFALILSRAFS